jgi:hypothetical protein
MDLDTLDPDRELTDEEFVQMEKELLETTRAFFLLTQKVCGPIAEKEPELAERLSAAAGKMLLNVEAGASEDGWPGGMRTTH